MRLIEIVAHEKIDWHGCDACQKRNVRFNAIKMFALISVLTFVFKGIMDDRLNLVFHVSPLCFLFLSVTFDVGEQNPLARALGRNNNNASWLRFGHLLVSLFFRFAQCLN